jgi:hypothetical protein
MRSPFPLGHMTTLEVVLRVGSAAGLISFAYLVAENRRKRSRLRYTHESRWGEAFYRDGLWSLRWIFEGILKNQSPESNAVARVHLVAWGNRGSNDTLRHEWGGVAITDRATGQTPTATCRTRTAGCQGCSHLLRARADWHARMVPIRRPDSRCHT